MPAHARLAAARRIRIMAVIACVWMIPAPGALTGPFAAAALAEPEHVLPVPAKNPLFDALAALQGSWASEEKGENGKPKHTVTYKVTAAGTAVVETLFPGEPHEMVTVYHRDGDAIGVTHYCALGNQPYLKTRPESTPTRLVFAFAGGPNIDRENGHYMGGLVLTITGKDRLKHEWSHFIGPKESPDKGVFEFVRQ